MTGKQLHELTRVERLAMGHFQRRGGKDRFEWEQKRIYEIKQIALRRHGPVLPETDDVDVYFRVMARTIAATYALPADQKSALAEWISNVAPWADAASIADGLIIDDPDYPFHSHFNARSLADDLKLTYAERKAFGITTISCFDKTPDEMKELKRQNDKERKRAARAAAGARPREQSYSRTQPWLSAGFTSRRSWEVARKRQRDELQEAVGEPVCASSAHPKTADCASSAHLSNEASCAITALPSEPRCANSSAAIYSKSQDSTSHLGGIGGDELAQPYPTDRRNAGPERAAQQAALAYLLSLADFDEHVVEDLYKNHGLSVTAAVQVFQSALVLQKLRTGE